MPIELTAVIPRGPRRLRLVFSAPLNGGAFGAPAPAHYVVENQDGRGATPDVLAAIVVGSADTNVELALSADLVPDALYRVSAIGVPGQDSSVSTDASVELVRVGSPNKRANVEPKVTDADAALYLRDLVWSGADYQESPDGDLATISGLPNARAALERRFAGAPLAWSAGYSPRARDSVDAPVQSALPLKGRLEAQAARDPRVSSAKAVLVTDGSDVYFTVTPSYVGGAAARTEALTVPVSSA